MQYKLDCSSQNSSQTRYLFPSCPTQQYIKRSPPHGNHLACKMKASTSTSHVCQVMVLIGCVLSFCWLVKPWRKPSRMAEIDIPLGLRGIIPPSSHLPWQGLVYCLAPEAPLFRGMLKGAKTFFKLPGMSGLLFCVKLLH